MLTGWKRLQHTSNYPKKPKSHTEKGRKGHRRHWNFFFSSLNRPKKWSDRPYLGQKHSKQPKLLLIGALPEISWHEKLENPKWHVKDEVSGIVCTQHSSGTVWWFVYFQSPQPWAKVESPPYYISFLVIKKLCSLHIFDVSTIHLNITYMLFWHLDMFGAPSKISSTICHPLHVLVTILPYKTLSPLCTGCWYTLKQVIL